MVNDVGLVAVYARFEGAGGVTTIGIVVDAVELVFPAVSAAVTKNV